jgi:hypothetical protein
VVEVAQGISIDVVSIVLFIFVLMLFGLIGLTFMVVYFFQRELAILPGRKKYRVDLYNTIDDKKILSRSIWGWVVTRKNTKYLRLSFDILIAGVEVDAGYLRYSKQGLDAKGKAVDILPMLEKIHGLKDPSNFEPFEMAYEVTPNLEREVRQTTVSLTEVAQRLATTSDADLTKENIQKFREAIQTLSQNVNKNMDLLIDHDRKLQASQVSGWGEYTSVGIEKATYKVKKDDPWEKYLPYIGIFAVLATMLVVTLIGADIFNRTVNTSAGQCAGACNTANEHFIAAATSCGWKKTTNVSINAPPGIALPT